MAGVSGGGLLTERVLAQAQGRGLLLHLDRAGGDIERRGRAIPLLTTASGTGLGSFPAPLSERRQSDNFTLEQTCRNLHPHRLAIALDQVYPEGEEKPS
ncbi:hypothetical protein AAFF_G00000140 [Aldrovandia affinis]|uniref:Uncharacterized protein n=1 Tax=Aldrovandia affinis TaxID=143900 RepID=A0AAD7X331_9TELE|nr:hypothetical protein AAFF_G00000140 [Aldrovandia affinis]